MAPDFGANLTASWGSMWTPNGPYHLPSALGAGRRVGLVWFRPLPAVGFPDTGPVVLMNRAPWGMVTLNLTDNLVSGLHSIEPVGFAHDPATGRVRAQVRFAELTYTGRYVVQQKRSTGSAVRVAARALGLGDPPAADGTDNIALANQYQTQLFNSASGRFMVGQYYDNNDAYVQAFQNTKFVKNWQTWVTNGQNTDYYAQQTSTAAQNPDGPPVNPAQDGSIWYSIHAFTMQSFVTFTCSNQGNQAAATAASTFGNTTSGPNNDGPAWTSQSVNQVIAYVANSTPPSSSEPPPAARAPLAAAGPEAFIAPPLRTLLPPERRAEMARAMAEIAQEEEEVRSGVLLREEVGRPVDSGFLARFASPVLELTGTARPDGPDGHPVVEFTRLTGPALEVHPRLGAFPGKLFPEVERELERAKFLHAVLGTRAVGTLGSSGSGRPAAVLAYLSRMMTLAAGQRLGPLS
jgi:hypothetical protein